MYFKIITLILINYFILIKSQIQSNTVSETASNVGQSSINAVNNAISSPVSVPNVIVSSVQGITDIPMVVTETTAVVPIALTEVISVSPMVVTETPTVVPMVVNEITTTVPIVTESPLTLSTLIGLLSTTIAPLTFNPADAIDAPPALNQSSSSVCIPFEASNLSSILDTNGTIIALAQPITGDDSDNLDVTLPPNEITITDAPGK
uniref:Uncharacterized protein n=1 Tax=Rhabditophanes sp. KR3021 TaxID=114890 RepID=A0AC35UBM2_9BILA